MTTFRRCIRPAIVVAVVLLIVAPRSATAQFDLSVERTLLAKLLRDGRYKQALAESRRVENAIVGRSASSAKGAKKKGQPPAVTVALVELLIYRGTVERRMGNLDAAEKTLTEAYSKVTDEDFQRMIRALAPSDKEQLAKYLVGLKLPFLQLVDNGTEVLIDRLRKFNYECQARAADGAVVEVSQELREEIESLFHRIDFLVRMSMRDRQHPLDMADDDPAAASPQATMMLTQARPFRLIGMRYLEASRLPWTVPFDADPATMAAEEAVEDERKTGGERRSSDAEPARVETAVERETQSKSQRLRAFGYLEKSREIAREAVEAARAGLQADGVAMTGAVDTLSDEDAAKRRVFQQEEARILAETAVPLTVLSVLEGDVAGARKLIDPAIESLSAAESPTHPELARPLMISAEIAVQEGGAAQARKDFTAAEKLFKQAAEQLRGAKAILESSESEFDPESPLHRVLADLLVKSELQQKQSRQVASAASVADAAARRALAALSRSESPRSKPKPAAKDDAKSATESKDGKDGKDGKAAPSPAVAPRKEAP